MNPNNYPNVYPWMMQDGSVVYLPYPPQPVTTPAPATPYSQANNRTHLITGLVAGAAITYLLTNRQVQQGISTTAGKVWGSVRGEMEEMKERVADLQAELDYYRSKDQEAQ